jgi:plasmid stability protein
VKRLTLDLEDDLHREFRVQAATVGISMADIGRALFREYLDASEDRKDEIHRLAAKLHDRRER